MSNRLDLANYLEEHKGVYEYLDNSIDENDLQIIVDALREEPKKVGHWVRHDNYSGNLRYYECSCCKNTQGYLSNYCEECGTRMSEEYET